MKYLKKFEPEMFEMEKVKAQGVNSNAPFLVKLKKGMPPPGWANS
eukprot:CAMPEP_0168624512 /NCGR_PEP_ID=MMETSP0449_2-20121227/9453_1 /TAXON_ID=1082188 /ORGANISM="Strombidium rassoulzadegani, Strain ras09" /LENGTH=44 /DNA_ID= /DNA_START= /DNA_END= /DNA_ORIENTATION=